MKTKRFDYNFRPLQINISLAVDGSVPDRQNYDAEAAEYTPDYTITPLIIQPIVSILDKDEMLQAGRVNAKLANIKWYEVISGASTLIETTNSNYEITTTGNNAGRIKVKRNAQEKVPITLVFTAEYVDSRTSQIYSVRDSYLILCSNSTAAQPILLLDAADQTIYNPLTDQDTQTVTASLRIGDAECAASKRTFVWEKYREDTKTWTTVGSDETADYDVKVSSDTTAAVVNRKLMGTELYLRCRAKYVSAGDATTAELTDASPCKVVAFVRRIPKYEFDYSTPTNIPAGLMYIYPEVKVWGTNGTIANPDKVLLPLWYMATNKASGSLSYTQVAHGIAPAIPTTLISNTLGGVMGLDMIDPGPACAIQDGDGNLIVDGDGNIILIN